MVAAVEFPEHFLYPATLFVSNKPTRVQTILGSCVSVCLYDPVLKIGAINHFMLSTWAGIGLQSPKYGDVAIAKLVEKMTEYGCRRENLVAKLFGGAEQHENGTTGFQIGSRNILVAERILEKERIPIVAKSLGGTRGRKVIYYTHNNQVFLKYLQSTVYEKN
jgi:chemotaxis protein CheD